jgi:hypothetical protein
MPGPAFSAEAEDIDSYLQQAKEAYEAGAPASARGWLSAIPGIIGPFPALSPISKKKRAEIFLDIAVCHFVENDTALARLSVESAYSIAHGPKSGRLSHPQFDAFRRNAVRNLRVASATGKGRWGAFKRSLLIPGWGQFYSRHTKKGTILMGLGLGAAAAWGLKYNSYRSARTAYESTTRQDVISGGIYQDPGGRTYSEFESRHRLASSRASTANKLLGLLIGIWSYNILDSVVVGPGSFTIHFGHAD